MEKVNQTLFGPFNGGFFDGDESEHHLKKHIQVESFR